MARSVANACGVSGTMAPIELFVESNGVEIGFTLGTHLHIHWIWLTQLPVDGGIVAQLRRPLLRSQRQAQHALVAGHQLQRHRPVRLQRPPTAPKGKNHSMQRPLCMEHGCLSLNKLKISGNCLEPPRERKSFSRVPQVVDFVFGTFWNFELSHSSCCHVDIAPLEDTTQFTTCKLCILRDKSHSPKPILERNEIIFQNEQSGCGCVSRARSLFHSLNSQNICLNWHFSSICRYFNGNNWRTCIFVTGSSPSKFTIRANGNFHSNFIRCQPCSGFPFAQSLDWLENVAACNSIFWDFFFLVIFRRIDGDDPNKSDAFASRFVDQCREPLWVLNASLDRPIVFVIGSLHFTLSQLFWIFISFTKKHFHFGP